MWLINKNSGQLNKRTLQTVVLKYPCIFINVLQGNLAGSWRHKLLELCGLEKLIQ